MAAGNGCLDKLDKSGLGELKSDGLCVLTVASGDLTGICDLPQGLLAARALSLLSMGPRILGTLCDFGVSSVCGFL